MLVTRGFAFVDLCGFTAFTEEHGVQETVRVLAEFRNGLREAASRRSVRLAKWLGDGAMIVAVEPRPLVELLLEVSHTVASTKLALNISAGATVGSAIIFEGDDYISSCVNLAAHLCQEAHASEVFVTPELEPFLPPWAEVFDRGNRAVAGFARPVPTLSIGVAQPADGDSQVEDPVCHLKLACSKVPYSRDMAGQTFWFCSDACLSTWEGLVLSAG